MIGESRLGAVIRKHQSITGSVNLDIISIELHRIVGSGKTANNSDAAASVEMLFNILDLSCLLQ